MTVLGQKLLNAMQEAKTKKKTTKKPQKKSPIQQAKQQPETQPLAKKEFKIPVAVRILTSVKPRQRYSMAKELMNAQLKCILYSRKDGYVTAKVLTESFMELSKWLQKLQARIDFKLHMDLLEKSLYMEVEKITGIETKGMAGLINIRKNTQRQTSKTKIETEARLVRKLGIAISKALRGEPNAQKHPYQKRHKTVQL